MQWYCIEQVSMHANCLIQMNYLRFGLLSILATEKPLNNGND